MSEIRGLIGDRRLGVEYLVDPLRRSRSLLAGGQDVSHRLDGPYQLEGQRDEGDQAAEAQLVPACGERSEQHDEPDDRVRHQVQAGPEGAAQPRLGQLGLVSERRLPGVPGRCRVAAAEGLQDPDAGRRFLDVGSQVALLVLGAPGQHAVPALEAQADRDDRQEHAARQRAEPPVHPDEQRDHDEEGHHVGDEEDDAETSEPPDR